MDVYISGDNFRHAQKMCAEIQDGCAHKTGPKTSFFIKITISQYHDIDISYIDIDISKNAFSMTTLENSHIYICIYIYIKLNIKVQRSEQCFQPTIYFFVYHYHCISTHSPSQS